MDEIHQRNERTIPNQPDGRRPGVALQDDGDGALSTRDRDGKQVAGPEGLGGHPLAVEATVDAHLADHGVAGAKSSDHDPVCATPGLGRDVQPRHGHRPGHSAGDVHDDELTGHQAAVARGATDDGHALA